MSNTVITVANAAELMSALAGATGGETIRLQAGNYGGFGLWNVRDTFVNNYTSAVTITSANPNDLAVFTAVGLNGVKNLSFDAVKFDYTATAGDPDWARPFNIENSTGITFANSIFEGDLEYTYSAAGTGIGYGLAVFYSQNVTISHNEFFNWARAAVFGSVTNLNVTGNDVHDVRSDGFDFTDVDNVLIEQNYLHDFVQAQGIGDHLDMIQFWTSGTTSPSTNIVIRGNFLDSGTGLPSQSIFMRNEMVDTGAAGDEMFYRNILIEDNVIHNAHVHGITVGETHGLIIRNNTVLHNADSGNTGLVDVPTINVAAASTQVTVTNNILPRLPSIGSAGALVTNNLIVQSDFPDGANYVGNLFVDALAGVNATLAGLQAIPGGILQQLGVGSSLTDFSTQPASPIGFIVDDAGSGLSLLTHSLDASNLYGPNGRIDLQGASVVWNFGDGTTASGVSVDHAFAHAGRYDVTATITLAGGTVVQVDKTIAVQTPVALQANFDNGAQDLSDITNPVTVGTGVTFEPGASGQAIRLNGGLVTYQVNSELLNNSEYTVLFDFKKDVGQEGAGGRVINFSGGVVVFIESNGITAAITTDQGSKWLTVSNIGINDADWHKVALTFSANAGAAILYVDGAAVGQVDGLSGIQVASSGHGFSIGDPWGGNSFPGLIDNVAFLKGSLSAQEFVDGGTIDNAPPVALISDHSVQANEWVFLKNWLSYSDADNNAATTYQFFDAGMGASSGYFYTPDNPHHAAGSYIDVSASGLDTTWIRGGQTAGSETMWVRAFDGTDWSAWDAFTFTTTLSNTAPQALIGDHSVQANEWVFLKNWLSYSDADNNAATTYQFFDAGMGASSGYFYTPDNPHHAAGSYIDVSASGLDTTWIRGGQTAGSETMWVRAFDGTDWSAWDAFTFTTTLSNTAPQALIGDHSVQANEWVFLKNWLSYSDADNNAATTYQFFDAGMGASSGYFYTPDNPHHAAGSYIDVSASGLDTTWIRGGQTAGSETMWVRAFDGTDWSAWDAFTFTTTLSNTAPQALIGDHSVQANEWVFLKNWLSYSDADNNAATTYQFFDAGMGASSGYFYTPDDPHHAAGSYIDVSASGLDTTWIRGGQTAGSETMWVRAFDGTDWSAWDAFTVTTLV